MIIMTRLTAIVVAGALLPTLLAAQEKRFALDSTAGLKPHNVAAQPATLHGKTGVRLTISEETMRRVPGMTPAEQNQLELLAVIDGVEFSNGVIEAEIGRGQLGGGALEADFDRRAAPRTCRVPADGERYRRRRRL